MIASVRGIVQHVGLQEVVLEVGGMGAADCRAAGSARPRAHVIGHAMFLHTRLIVREDGAQPVRVQYVEQREVFDLLSRSAVWVRGWP